MSNSKHHQTPLINKSLRNVVSESESPENLDDWADCYLIWQTTLSQWSCILLDIKSNLVSVPHCRLGSTGSVLQNQVNNPFTCICFNSAYCFSFRSKLCGKSTLSDAFLHLHPCSSLISSSLPSYPPESPWDCQEKFNLERWEWRHWGNRELIGKDVRWITSKSINRPFSKKPLSPQITEAIFAWPLAVDVLAGSVTGITRKPTIDSSSTKPIVTYLRCYLHQGSMLTLPSSKLNFC